MAILQLVGIILAIQTRHVKIQALSDSKFVAALIYITSISLIINALVGFVLATFINVVSFLLSAGIIVVATLFLLLTFVPKVS